VPYLGTSPTQAGSFIFLDDIASSFNNNATAFNLAVGGVAITPNTQNLLIALDGVIQQAPDAYTVSGSTITFTSAVPSGTDFYGILMGQSASVGQGTIGADELKITGNGTSGQSIISDGDSTFSYTNHLPLAGGTMTGVLNMNSQNITNAGTIQGTLSTASQTNITSVGTLSSLNVSGNAVISGTLQSDDFTLDAGSGNPDLVIKTTATESATAQALFLTGSHDFSLINDTANFRLYNSTPTIGVDVIKVIGSSSDILFGDVGNSRHLSLDYSNGDVVVNGNALGVGAVPRQYYKLDVYNNGNSTIFGLRSESHGCTQYFQTGNTLTGQLEFTTSQGWLTTRTNSPLKLGVNNTPRMTLGTSEAEINYDLKTTGHITVDTGGTSIITADGNNSSGDDGRLLIKGHTAAQSRAFIYLNNGVSSGGLDWRIGCLRYSNAFVLSLGNDDYNNSTNVFAVDGNRKIGIGTDPGSEKVKISGSVYSDTTSQFAATLIGNITIANTQFAMIGSNSSSRGIAICRDGSASFPDFRINGDGTCRINGQLTTGSGIINGGNLYSSASSGSHFCGLSNHRWHTVYGVNSNFSSDQTLKKNIKTSDLGIDFINSLNPVKFNWKKSFQDDTQNHYGFLAQEIVKTALADSVSGDEGEMGMNYSELIAPIVKAIQELSSKVNVLEGN
tara:strand:- start:7590 stop:9611 length:2022 start_codon:yes stop_codon:yes gene_type:complete